jgi:hypothetical protein
MLWTKYSSTQMGVRFPPVMPAQAGIQSLHLDSRQKHAGMTIWDYGHAILSRGTKGSLSLRKMARVREDRLWKPPHPGPQCC